MLEWLLAPLSGAATHSLAPWAYWHARLMVLGWAVLLPVGVLVARFYKVTPRQDWPRQLDNKTWWHAHRGLQWAGVVAVAGGAAWAWGQGSAASSAASSAAQLHATLGWALCAAALLQIVGGQLRGSKGGPTGEQMRGDHYDMTPRRRWFERVHKGLGWLALLASVLAIALGLWVADAPRWMALALALWWLALGIAFARLQAAGRCIDTYQAIWGPDRAHPGNALPQPGWGARRPLG